MTFAPTPRSSGSLPPALRRYLFWFLIFAAGFVLWQALKGSNDAGSSSQISYSEFLQQAANNNVATATLTLSKNTAEVRGNLRQPQRQYRVTAPRVSVSDLTDPLQKAGVNVDVSQVPAWSGELLTFAPLLLLIAVSLLILIKRINSKFARPPAGISNPVNRPL